MTSQATVSAGLNGNVKATRMSRIQNGLRTSPAWLHFGILACAGWLSLFPMVNVPLWMHHIPTVLTLLTATFLMVNGRAHVTGSQIAVMVLAVPVLISTVVTGDREGMLFAWSYVATLIAFISIGSTRYPRAQTFIWYFAAVVLPEFLISKYVLGPVVKTEGTFISEANTIRYIPTLVPLPENGWHIHIGPWGETYHYSASVALVLGAIAFVLWLRTRSAKYAALIALSLYLVIFSGTRTSYLCLITMGLLYAVNRGRRRVSASWMVIIAMILVLFGADAVRSVIPQTDNRAFNALLRQNNSDITSGRQWLWSYHLQKFAESPVTGIGFARTRFRIGDSVDGGRALASSESFYTQVLAAFGLFGLCFTAIHIYLITCIFRYGDVLRIMLAGMIVIGTAGNSWFASVYVPVSFFVFAFCCCSLDARGVAGKKNSVREAPVA